MHEGNNGQDLKGRLEKLADATQRTKSFLATEAIEKYVSIFGKDHFLIELMDHGMQEQTQTLSSSAASSVEEADCRKDSSLIFEIARF